jgi:hypothetical protein
MKLVNMARLAVVTGISVLSLVSKSRVSVRPGGACGRLASIKLPTSGRLMGEHQAVPWAVMWKRRTKATRARSVG